MKMLVLAAIAALNAGVAFAHPSFVPHAHPHHGGMLPDALALVLAALLVGTGFVVFRRMRKE
jgi:hypothetical protein